MDFLRMGDESYYGLNGLRVNYAAAEGSYELAVKNKEGPRAELMLALCNDRLYSGQEKEILRLLKKAAKGGDLYAKRCLESGERAEPPALWGVKTADVISNAEPMRSSEEYCILAQDYYDAYGSAKENGRRQEAKMNLIKSRYYADLAAEEERKAADIFDPPILGTEAEQLRHRAEMLLAAAYMDDGPDEAGTGADEETMVKPDLMGGDTGEIPIITDMHQAEYHMERGNYDKAYEHYRKAAESGSDEACMRIAKLYGGSKYLGWYPQEQEKWLKKASTLGCAAAEAELNLLRKSVNFMKSSEASQAKEATEKEEEEKQEMFAQHLAATEAIVNGNYETAKDILEKIVRGPAEELVAFAAYDLFGLAGYADSLTAKDAAVWLNLAAKLNHEAAVQQLNRVKKIAADIGISEVYVIRKFIDDRKAGKA